MEPETIVAAVAANIAWNSQKAKSEALPVPAEVKLARKKSLAPNRPALLAPNMRA